MGVLAGQVGASVTVSQGQLVVRTTTPRRGDYYTPEPNQSYALTSSLAHAGSGESVAFRGCGTGCFVADLAWSRGDNVLTLRAAADGWQGGDVGLLIPWPPRPAADQLAKAVAVTRAAAGGFTVYQTVTSNTATAAGITPQRLDVPVDFFLSQEPSPTAPPRRRRCWPRAPAPHGWRWATRRPRSPSC
jgi:copper transport protein